MNRVASELHLPGHPGNYPIRNPNTHFVTSSDQAKLVIRPFHQHPARAKSRSSAAGRELLRGTTYEEER